MLGPWGYKRVSDPAVQNEAKCINNFDGEVPTLIDGPPPEPHSASLHSSHHLMTTALTPSFEAVYKKQLVFMCFLQSISAAGNKGLQHVTSEPTINNPLDNC